jgi:hypothetical protein
MPLKFVLYKMTLVDRRYGMIVGISGSSGQMSVFHQKEHNR